MPVQKQLAETEKRGVFYITRRCDLRCWYCNVPRIHADKRDELDVPGIRRVLHNLKRLGVDLLTIFGGEPMLRYAEIEEVLPQILEFAYPVLNTNGRLIVISDEYRDSYERMVNMGLNNMSVSVDMMTQNHLSKDMDGSESKSIYAWDALEIAKSLGVTDLSLNAVIDTANPSSVLPVLEESSRLGYDVRMSIVQTPKANNEENSFAFGVTTMEKEELDTVLSEIIARAKEWNVRTTVEYFEAVIDGHDVDFVCNTPGYIVVTPDGKYQLCQSIYGEELLKLPLETSWEDYQDAWYKDLDKHCPGCYLNCHVDYHVRHGLWK